MSTWSAPPLAAELISDALSGVASALQVPVHVAGLVLLLLLALEVGRALTETFRRIRPGHARLLDVATNALRNPAAAPELARKAPSAIAERAVSEMATAAAIGHPDGAEPALAEFELGVQRRLDRTRMLVRAGPAVGLMGTLIPLAPGLAALGEGDIAGLANDLRTAFAATVVGILVGTVSFALTLWRTRVYTEDLAALERAVSTHAREVATGRIPPNGALPATVAPVIPSGPTGGSGTLPAAIPTTTQSAVPTAAPGAPLPGAPGTGSPAPMPTPPAAGQTPGTAASVPTPTPATAATPAAGQPTEILPTVPPHQRMPESIGDHQT